MRGRFSLWMWILARLVALMAPSALAAKGGNKGGNDGGGDSGDEDPPAANPALLWTDTAGRSGSTWEVRVADADGLNASTLLAATGDGLAADPSWSPNGSYFVYRGDDAYGDPALHVASADGASTTQIHAGQAYDPKWSPATTADGTARIVFAASTSAGPWDLFAVTPSGTGLVNLTSTPNRHETYPTWSPDGLSVAARYADYDAGGTLTQRGIVVYAITTVSGVLTATVDLEITDATSELTDIAFLDWSRTGDKIACSAVGGTYADRDIWVIDLFAPGSPTNVTASSGVLEKWPTWSPDDTEIAYTRNGGNKKDKGIFVMAASGSGSATAVIKGGGEHYRRPDWLR